MLAGGRPAEGREIARLGHAVRLIAPADVTPFVRRQKNDAADAEAICEAAQRPAMRFVAVKSEDQQASAVVFRARDLLVRQRPQLINALRGHLAEYGWVVPKGPAPVAALARLIGDPDGQLPESAVPVFRLMLGSLAELDQQIAALEVEITRRAKQDPVAKRLMTIPGIGPIAATAIAALARDLPQRPRLCGVGRAHAPAEINGGANRSSAPSRRWARERCGAC